MLTYEQAKALRRSIKNPWLTVAIDRICKREWMHEFILSVMEYNGMDAYYGVGTCPMCGGEMWYRATVGAPVCWSCHHVKPRGG